MTSARERILEVVPGLDELLERGAPGDQVQSQPLAAGAAEQAWLLWFVWHRNGLVILAPVIVHIVEFHVFLAPGGLPLAVLVAALATFLAWAHRSAYRPLFAPAPRASFRSGTAPRP